MKKDINAFYVELKAYLDNNFIKDSDDQYHINIDGCTNEVATIEALQKGIEVYDREYNQIVDDMAYSYTKQITDSYTEYDNYARLFDLTYEYISDHVTINIDTDDVQLETYTLLNVGDANYEYVIPDCYIRCIELDKNFATNERFLNSAITWLIKSQDYDPIQFVKDLHSDNGYTGDSIFLKSLASELAECYTTGSYAVCIPSVMDLNDYINIIRQQKDKRKLFNYFKPLSYKGNSCMWFCKGSRIGLFDALNGGGSNFGVFLEQNIKVPLSCADVQLNYGNTDYGYTVRSVYGETMSDDCHGLSHYHLMSQSDIKSILNR